MEKPADDLKAGLLVLILGGNLHLHVTLGEFPLPKSAPGHQQRLTKMCVL